MDKEELPLTREDFDDAESWLRHCHEGGIDLVREEGDDFDGVAGAGLYAQRLSAIYGPTHIDYLKAWEGVRTSHSLRWRQFVKAYEAIAFANCMGLVLDSSLDITWSLQGIITDTRIAERQGMFLDALRRWYDRNGERAAFYWVLERGSRRGVHTHLTLHVPPTLTDEFYTFARSTLARIVKGPLHHERRERAMYFQPRAGRDIIRQWSRFTYVMKALDPNLMWIDRKKGAVSARVKDWNFMKLKSQGEIAGKRMGVSRFLDDASRRRWASVNDFPDMAFGQNGPLLDDSYIVWHRANRDHIVCPARS